MQDFGLQSLVFFACAVVFAFWKMERKLNGLSTRDADYRVLRDEVKEILHRFQHETFCPECDHPAVGASFCEETPYTCPQCGEEFIWKLKNGRYFLATNIEGDPRE